MMYQLTVDVGEFEEVPGIIVVEADSPVEASSKIRDGKYTIFGPYSVDNTPLFLKALEVMSDGDLPIPVRG